MKIRGSLTITSDLKVPSPSGSTPINGKYGRTDSEGYLYWGELIVPDLDQSNSSYDKGALVLAPDGIIYSANEYNANGSFPLSSSWTALGGGGTILPQYIIDGLYAANAPASNNAFVTLLDMQASNIKYEQQGQSDVFPTTQAAIAELFNITDALTGNNFSDVPTDNILYGRRNQVWIQIPDTSIQTAIQVPFTPTGNTISIDVQGAIEELQTEIDGIAVPDISAVSVSFSPASGIVATNVQAAIEEVAGTGSCDCLSTIVLGPYPIGTPLENIIRDLHYQPDISGFNINAYGSFVEVNTIISDPSFSWTVVNGPVNLLMNDSTGNMVDVLVSGSSHTALGISWTNNVPGTETWSIKADGVSNKTDKVNWVYKSYWGKNTTGIPPTDVEILASVAENTSLSFTDSLIIGKPNTTDQEFLWFAVPKDFSGNYLFWEDQADTNNNGGIADINEFIRKEVASVSVGGIFYTIYISAYISEVTSDIKLSTTK